MTIHLVHKMLTLTKVNTVDATTINRRCLQDPDNIARLRYLLFLLYLQFIPLSSLKSHFCFTCDLCYLPCPQAWPSCLHLPKLPSRPQPSLQPHSHLRDEKNSIFIWTKVGQTHPPSGFAHSLSPSPEQTDASNSRHCSTVPLLQTT